ncbi:MAG: hypothetical protein ABR974_04695 [Bacteroidales bacterium]
MKKVLPLLFTIAIIMSGCGSSKKQLEKGNYDAAIEKAVKQLRKDPNDKKEAANLETAYKISNDQDNEKIRLLKTEGKASGWDEIYLLYKKLYDRQTLVRSVPQLNYPYVDYMQDMVAAKKNAADFYFAHGTELMKNNMKDSYRQAYQEFVRAKQYVGDYPGIDSKISESRFLGMSRVLVAIQNKSILVFPKEMMDQLLTLDLPALNSDWVEYHTQVLDQNTQFDYFVNININNIVVTPDQTVEADSTVKRDIDDGYNYVLDNKGNVMRDSLGNDIKVKKYKTVQCALIQTFQRKSCHIDGTIDVIQANPNRLLKQDPIGAQAKFENISSRAVGDIQALNQRQLDRTKAKIIPFPTDIDMVMRCSDNLKMAIRGAMMNDKRFIL